MCKLTYGVFEGSSWRTYEHQSGAYADLLRNPEAFGRVVALIAYQTQWGMRYSFVATIGQFGRGIK